MNQTVMPAVGTLSAGREPCRAYRMCSRCVMDTSDPGITFDGQGVCNHCHAFEARREARIQDGEAGSRAFAAIVDRIKLAGRGREYDCIVGISGGVDSTYVTYLAARHGLRVLAVHLDNGWNSELATHNIAQALQRLGIDLYTHVIEWNEFRDLQLAFLKASTPDSELPTDHAIFALMMRLANRYRIRYVLTGMNFATESINVEDWTYSPADFRYIRDVHRRFGTLPLNTYPAFSIPYLLYTLGLRRVHFVAPLNYMRYDRAAAAQTLQTELGWRDYGGKHHESIYTRFFQSYILPRKFSIDKRRAHYSDRIKTGRMTRAEALAELAHPPCDEQQMREDRLYTIKKLGLTEESFEEIMRRERRSFRDYANNDRLISRFKRVQLWLRKHALLHK